MHTKGKTRNIVVKLTQPISQPGYNIFKNKLQELQMLSSVTKIVWIQIEHIELKSTLNCIFDIWYPAGLLCYLWVIADVKAPLGEKQTALEFKCVKINAFNFCLRYCFGQNKYDQLICGFQSLWNSLQLFLYGQHIQADVARNRFCWESRPAQLLLAGYSVNNVWVNHFIKFLTKVNFFTLGEFAIIFFCNSGDGDQAKWTVKVKTRNSVIFS